MKRIKLIELIKEVIKEAENKLTIPALELEFNSDIKKELIPIGDNRKMVSLTGDKTKVNKGEYLPTKKNSLAPIFSEEDLEKWKKENISSPDNKIAIDLNKKEFADGRFDLLVPKEEDWMAAAIARDREAAIAQGKTFWTGD